MATTSPTLSRTSWPRRTLLPTVVIVCAGVLAYASSFSGAFLFDDLQQITENPHIQHLWPPWEAMSLAQDVTPASRPVVSLSLAMNYAVDKFRVRGYHAFNLGVHILAALVLFGIVRRTLGLAGREQSATGLATVIALIWMVHPLQTQSVTYVIQRAESMMGLFYLLTIYCFIRGVDSVHAGTWQGLGIAACALGMGTKPVMVTAPMMVLLFDRVFVAGSLREALAQRWKLYAGLGATWLILAALLVAFPSDKGAGFAMSGVGPMEYGLSQFGVILHYLALAFWPRNLVLDYGWPVAHNTSAVVIPAVPVLTLLGLTLWALYRAGLREPRMTPALGFLGGWFFLTLAPSSSFIPIRDLCFEHRMYLPLAGVVALVVVAAHKLLGKLRPELWRRSLGVVLALAVAGTLGALTYLRNQDYRDPMRMWAKVLEKRPTNARAAHNLGVALAESGRIPEAIEEYKEALRLRPDYPEAHVHLGVGLAESGRIPEAIEQFEEALRLRPDYVDAHNNLGVVLANSGRIPEAIAQYEEALRLRPNNAEAHINLGNVLVKVGRVPEAIEHCQEALRLRPEYPEAHVNLGVALAKCGRIPEAIAQFEEALRLRPDYAEAEENLRAARQMQLQRP